MSDANIPGRLNCLCEKEYSSKELSKLERRIEYLENKMDILLERMSLKNKEIKAVHYMDMEEV
jgi:hypothetical protein